MTEKQAQIAIKLNRAEHDLECARQRGIDDLRPYIIAVNDARRDAEYARRDAIRARVYGKAV